MKTISIARQDFIPLSSIGVPGGVSAYDHAHAGVYADIGHNHSGLYLESETDPVFTAWDKSMGISITESQISDFGSYSVSSHNHDLTYLGISAKAADSELLDGLDSTTFAILAGQVGGQTLIGGIASGENLTLQSTSHVTKGRLLTDPITITSPIATAIGLIIKGATSQSANLLVLQDSLANIIHKFPISGGSVTLNELRSDMDFSFRTPSTYDAFNYDSGLDALGIGQAANTNYKVGILSTKRYGLYLESTQTSGATGSAFAGNYTTSISQQGAGMSFTATSVGTTAGDDFLIGMVFTVDQRRTANMTGIWTIGMDFNTWNNVNSDSSYTYGDMIGMNFAYGLGYSSGGAGTQTWANVYGLKLGLTKNTTGGGGIMTTTNVVGLYVPASGTWGVPGTWTITNAIGAWWLNQTKGTNNTNLLLGGTGTAGNWSIYNNSAYDSLLLAGATKGHLRDTGIYIASLTDGHLDLTADISIDLNGLVESQNIVPAIEDTYYLGEIGTPFKSYKAVILKDTTDGKHYQIRVASGVVTATALD